MPLPVIGLGKRGGKIVGYDKKGQPIYQGSKAAQKLEAAQKAEVSGKTYEGFTGKQWAQAADGYTALAKRKDIYPDARAKYRGQAKAAEAMAAGKGRDVAKQYLAAIPSTRNRMEQADSLWFQMTQKLKAAFEGEKPKLVLPVEGWPKKKDTHKITHPGVLPTDPKIKWPAGYPGVGFKAEPTYKGKQYKVEFLEQVGKIAVKVTYPDKKTRTWDSPNKASDSMYLHAKGLPLDMSATEKRKRKISLPAKTAFGITAFKGDLPLLPGKNAQTRTKADLVASGEVPADATQVNVGGDTSTRQKRPVNEAGKALKQGDSVTKTRRGLGKVSLALIAKDRYEVSYEHPKTKKQVVTEFKSINSASDHVWLVSKGYESRQDYQAQTGQTRIKSGGGWKFWGLQAEQVTWLTSEPKPAGEVTEPKPAQAVKEAAREKASEPGWERMPEVETESKEGRPKAHDAPNPKEDIKAKAESVTFGNEADAKAAAERKTAEIGKPYKVIVESSTLATAGGIKGTVWKVVLEKRQLTKEEKALRGAEKAARLATTPDEIELWDDEAARENMLQWGDWLASIQDPTEKDRTGFSNSDQKSWGWVSSMPDNLLALKMTLKKYKRQLLGAFGDDYWRAGLGDPIPGWDDVDRKTTFPEFKDIVDANQQRAMALNWEYQTKLNRSGANVVQMSEDYPLRAGDIVRCLSPTGEPVEMMVNGFGKSFRTRTGWQRYAYMVPPPDLTQKAVEFGDEEVGNPQDEKPGEANFTKTYRTKYNTKGKLVCQLPTDHGLEAGDVIKISGERSGLAKVTGTGKSWTNNRTGKQEHYVYLAMAEEAEAGRPVLSKTEKLINGLKTGSVKDKLVVQRDEDGAWYLHAAYHEGYNTMMRNRGGAITGVTEWDPVSKSRKTLDLALVEEITEKVKEKFGWDVVFEDGALEKAQAARAAEEAELRKPIPGVQAKLAEGIELFPYQNQGVKFLDKTDGNAIIGDEMGLGKTLQTLAWAAMREKKVAVVCPKVVRRNWVKEGEKFFPGYFRGKELTPEDLRKYVAQMEKKIKAAGRGKTGDAADNAMIEAGVVAREELVADLAKYNLVSLNYESVAKYQEYLKEAGFDTMVIDESHRIKNPKAKVTKTLQAMAKDFQHHILLTGTAIKNKKEELFTQINMVAPGMFRSAKALKSDTIGGTWNKIQQVYIARQKKKVLTDLPDKINTIIDAEYERGNPDLNLDLDFENISTVKAALTPAKAKGTTAFVQELLDSSDSAVLVFTETIEAAKRIAGGLGDTAILHYAEGMSYESRMAKIAEFQKEDSPKRVFVTTRKSMEAGHNLQRADKVVFNDLPWTPADIRQAEDRAHRIGTKNTVNSYWMTADHPLDKKISELIKRKFDISAKVTQGKQLTPEEVEWQDKTITEAELIAGLRGETGVGEDEAKQPSPAGWERFKDAAIPWKEGKVLSQDKVQKLPKGSLVRITVQVAPDSPVRETIYEKRSDDNWAMWMDGEQQPASVEDSEVAQVANHWPKHGGTMHYSTPQMKRRPVAEKDAPPKPKGFSKYRSILIPSKNEAWLDMLAESGIDDHDMVVYDASYRKYLESGNKSDLPPSYTQGEMDSINEEIKGAKVKLPQAPGMKREGVSGPLEGFHELLKLRMQEARRKRATWEDVEELLPLFRDIPGFEKLRLPSYANDILTEARVARQLAEEEAERAGEETPEVTEPEPEPEIPTSYDDVPFDIPDSGPEGFRQMDSPSEEQLRALPEGAVLEKDLDADTAVQLIKMGQGMWQSKVTGRKAKLYETPDLVLAMRQVEKQLDGTQWWLDEASAVKVAAPGPEAPPKPATSAKRYYYGMSLRPPGPGAQPKGEDFKIESGPDAKDRNRRHGVVSYAAPLDPDQARRMDLVPLLDAKQITEAVDKVAAEMSEYAAGHLELASEDPKYMRQAIASVVERELGLVDLGNWDTFQDRVTEALAQVAAEQGAEETPGPGVAADRPSGWGDWVGDDGKVDPAKVSVAKLEMLPLGSTVIADQTWVKHAQSGKWAWVGPEGAYGISHRQLNGKINYAGKQTAIVAPPPTAGGKPTGWDTWVDSNGHIQEVQLNEARLTTLPEGGHITVIQEDKDLDNLRYVREGDIWRKYEYSYGKWHPWPEGYADAILTTPQLLSELEKTKGHTHMEAAVPVLEPAVPQSAVPQSAGASEAAMEAVARAVVSAAAANKALTVAELAAKLDLSEADVVAALDEIKVTPTADGKIDLAAADKKIGDAAKEAQEVEAKKQPKPKPLSKAVKETHKNLTPEQPKLPELEDKTTKIPAVEQTDGSKITSVGNHIWGSRKDLADLEIRESKQLDNISYQDAAAIVTKKRLVPVHDADTMKAFGVEPAAAHMGLALLAAIQQKPGDSDRERREYVDRVQEVMASIKDCKTLDNFRIMLQEMAQAQRLAERAERQSKKGQKVMMAIGHASAKEEAARMTRETGIKHKAQRGSWGGTYEIVPDEGQNLYGVLGKRFLSFINRKGKVYTDAYSAAYRLNTLSPEEGWAALETRGKAKGKKQPVDKRAAWVFKKQVSGEAIRKGHTVEVEDANPQRVMDTFNLREVDYGQQGYMTEADREEHTKSLEGAMHDFAEILGLPPATLSLNGRLGIAMGARGRGKAKAHYETGRHVINITKFRGGGSLAHEWGHAMDNIVASHYLPDKGKAAGNYITEAPEHPDLPADVRAAMGEVLTAIMGHPDEVQARKDHKEFVARLQTKVNKTILRNNELVHQAKAIKALPPSDRVETRVMNLREKIRHAESVLKTVEGKKNKAARDLRSNYELTIKIAKQDIADLKAGKGIRTSEKEKELEEVLGEIDAITTEINRQKSDLAMARKCNPTESHYVRSAKALGQYWARPVELFARAFESYVEDSLSAAKRTNTYLVDGTQETYNTGKRVATGDAQPYPQGDERKRINVAMENLLRVVTKGGHLAKSLAALKEPRFILRKGA